MAEIVYSLCAVTSIFCAVLLLRAHKQNGGRLVFWSGLCFCGLAVNNILLFMSLGIPPETDLSVWRNGAALIAISLLLYGLVMERAR
jgi:hypothetical protein